MTRHKGKLVGLAAAVVGIATLGVAGFAFRGWVVEEYYIWKLGSKDPADLDAPAKRLGEMRCVRTVPALLETAVRTGRQDDGQWQPFRPYLMWAIGRIGRQGLPSVSKAFDRGDLWRACAYQSLQKISESEKLDDVKALLFQVEKESSPDSALHRAAVDLLPKVKAYTELAPIRP